MTKRRERAKAHSSQAARPLEPALRPKVNKRKEKLADFLIDVAKYVFTGVIISSLFNDVTDRVILYLLGMSIILVTLLLGLSLTSKRKE